MTIARTTTSTNRVLIALVGSSQGDANSHYSLQLRGNTVIGATFRMLFESLATKSLLTEARSRVFKNTNLIISIKHLLTTASNCWESHPKLKVKVSVLILTYLTAHKYAASCFLPDLKVLGFHTLARSL